MIYKIKNISNDVIYINNQEIKPGQEIQDNDISKYRHMINRGFLMFSKDNIDNYDLINKIQELQAINETLAEQLQNDKNKKNLHGNDLSDKIAEETQDVKNNHIDLQENFNNIVNLYDKEKVLEALFHLFIDRTVTDTDLYLIKTFYKHIGITKLISNDKLDLLNNAKNYEELIAVLLNTIYPCLFRL